MFIDIASDKMNELVSAVSERGTAGKLVLEISVKKATRGGAMKITGKLTLKKPAEEPMEAMLFATPEGNLVADDPKQTKLDLKVAPGAQAAAEIAVVALQNMLERHTQRGRIGATGEELKALELLADTSLDYWNRRSGALFAEAYRQLVKARRTAQEMAA